MRTHVELTFAQFCSARQNVPLLYNGGSVPFHPEAGRAGTDLAHVLSGRTEHRRTNRHFGEDVGLSHPPAKGVRTIRRLFLLILFNEGKKPENILE